MRDVLRLQVSIYQPESPSSHNVIDRYLSHRMNTLFAPLVFTHTQNSTNFIQSFQKNPLHLSAPLKSETSPRNCKSKTLADDVTDSHNIATPPSHIPVGPDVAAVVVASLCPNAGARDRCIPPCALGGRVARADWDHVDSSLVGREQYYPGGCSQAWRGSLVLSSPAGKRTGAPERRSNGWGVAVSRDELLLG
ncbi:MAG: hypothetical protein FRX48_02674 [Lasallia pustulata]|uniref:Uncharacterized protein n=1 Tax=Lasallia pustulata TaxID=136370 RepID=A0A5M8PY33_9LECA|nr:MAG: hypothetical protein FRX48_02674 [Lasallia pustulata]